MCDFLLPPTPRDFEIHRDLQIEHLPTRRVAERHKVSQTRVRQITVRVNRWLAQNLPPQTDVEQEQEARLARHLAAAQLEHQCQQLQLYWEGTSDPKFLRQQTRVILALARLGVTPGAIDALAGEPEGQVESPRSNVERQGEEEVESPKSKVESQGNEAYAPRSSDIATSQLSTFDLRPSTELPPSEDCSAASEAAKHESAEPPAAGDVTDWPQGPFDCESIGLTPYIDGLTLIEKRLLTLLSNIAPHDVENRQPLEQTLAKVRGQKATLELRLSAEQPGVEQRELAHS